MLFITLISTMSILNIMSVFLAFNSKHKKINWNAFILLIIFGCLTGAFVYAYRIVTRNLSDMRDLFKSAFTVSTLSCVVPSIMLIIFWIFYSTIDGGKTSSVKELFMVSYSIILWFMIVALIFNIRILFSTKWTNNKVIYIIYFIQLLIILIMSITWGLDINPPDNFLGVLVWSDAEDYSGQLGSFLFAGINVFMFSSYLWIWNTNQKQNGGKSYNHSLLGSYGVTVFLIIMFSVWLTI